MLSPDTFDGFLFCDSVLLDFMVFVFTVFSITMAVQLLDVLSKVDIVVFIGFNCRNVLAYNRVVESANCVVPFLIESLAIIVEEATLLEDVEAIIVVLARQCFDLSLGVDLEPVIIIYVGFHGDNCI